jgi:hypothetical protein
MRAWTSDSKISRRGGGRELPELPAGRRFFVCSRRASSVNFRFNMLNLILYHSINNETREYKIQSTKKKDDHIVIVNTFFGWAWFTFDSSKSSQVTTREAHYKQKL